MRGFWEGSLLEYGGLKPILPFLGGRSDAACRVVIWPSRPHLWEPMVFITSRWLGRAFATLDTSPTKRAMAPCVGVNDGYAHPLPFPHFSHQ